MKEIGIFLKDSTFLDRDYMEALTAKYSTIEEIRPHLLRGMRLV